jgi:hypothetical protein
MVYQARRCSRNLLVEEKARSWPFRAERSEITLATHGLSLECSSCSRSHCDLRLQQANLSTGTILPDAVTGDFEIALVSLICVANFPTSVKTATIISTDYYDATT